jgi:hypothetical protein
MTKSLKRSSPSLASGAEPFSSSREAFKDLLRKYGQPVGLMAALGAERGEAAERSSEEEALAPKVEARPGPLPPLAKHASTLRLFCPKAWLTRSPNESATPHPRFSQFPERCGPADTPFLHSSAFMC